MQTSTNADSAINWNYTHMIENSYLSSLSVSATSYHLLVCHKCNIALTTNSMIQHLTQVHHVQFHPSAFQQAADACMILKTYPPVPTNPVSPVWGLTTYPAFKCLACPYFAIDLTLVLNHFSCEHINTGKQSQWEQICIQHLGSEHLEHQFQVLKPSDEKISNDVQSFADTILRKVDTRLHTQLQSFQASLIAVIQRSVTETIRKELQTHTETLINTMKQPSSTSLVPDKPVALFTPLNPPATTHITQMPLNTGNTSVDQQVQNLIPSNSWDEMYANDPAPLIALNKTDTQLGFKRRRLQSPISTSSTPPAKLMRQDASISHATRILRNNVELEIKQLLEQYSITLNIFCRKALTAIAEYQTDVVVCTATNNEKLLLTSCVAKLISSSVGSIIIVVATQGSLSDYIQHFKDCDVEFEVLKPTKLLETFQKVNLLLMKDAHSNYTVEALKSLNRHMPITHIFIDEPHVVFINKDTYPKCSTLRLFSAQCVLLSTNLSFAHLSLLRETYSLDVNAIYLCANCIRPEIQFWHETCIGSTMIARICEIAAQYTKQFNDEDRGIIFVPSHTVATAIEEQLHCLSKYKQYMTSQEKDDIFSKWYSAMRFEHKWIISSGAFTIGHNYSHVRVVIYACTPLGYSEFMQAQNYAGQDHKHAIAFYLAEDNVGQGQTSSIHKELCANPPICIRQLLVKHMYNKSRDVCSSKTDIPQCSSCMQNIGTSMITTTLDNSMTLPNLTGAQYTSSASILMNNAAVDLHGQKVAKELFAKLSKQSGADLQVITDVGKNQANHLFALLNLYRGRCMFCWVINQELHSTAQHGLKMCPTLRKLSSIDAYFNFRRTIHYTDLKVCYRCHVPTTHEILHVKYTPQDDSACPFKDLIIPTIYSCYHSNIYSFLFNAKPKLEDFIEWLGKRSTAPDFSNGILFFISWHDKFSM